MNLRKIISRRIRHSSGGVDVVGDVNAVIAGTVGKSGASRSHASSRQNVRIVQKDGVTEVSEQTETTEGGERDG